MACNFFGFKSRISYDTSIATTPRTVYIVRANDAKTANELERTSDFIVNFGEIIFQLGQVLPKL